MKILSLILMIFFLSSAKPFCQSTLIKDGKIYTDGQLFIPIVMNYTVNIRNDNGQYWVAPASMYFTTPPNSVCPNKQDCLNAMSAHFADIKNMGFNTIRLVNIEYGIANSPNPPANEPSLYTVSQYWNPIQFLKFNEPYTEQFQFIEDVLTVAKNNGLKVILLAGGKKIDEYKFQNKYSNYLQHLSKRFANNATLVAYDLLNEPAYFHTGHSKEAVCLMVDKWVKSIKDNTINQLVTIGLTNSETTFEWDVAVLNVDFISFHPYPLSKDLEDVLEGYSRELYWMGEVIKKPWIIGETGYSASAFKNNKKNHGNLSQQLDFAQKSAKYCFDCGGIGYSWWLYHDVAHDVDYGVVDSFHMHKPAANAFNTLSIYMPNRADCKIPQNYFNPTAYHKNVVVGHIFDKKGSPIKNAIIKASSVNGNVGWTFSDPYGSFVVYNDGLINKLTITAYGYRTTTRYTNFINSRLVTLRLTECGKEKNIKKYCKMHCKENKKECKQECSEECKKRKGWKKWQCKRACKKVCRKAYRECKKECKTL